MKPEIGPVSVRTPDARSRDDVPVKLHPAAVLRHVSGAKTLEAAAPWLRLIGMPTSETSDFVAVAGSNGDRISASDVKRRMTVKVT